MYENIRLIALDLDGTTLRPDKSLAAATRTAIEDALAAGIQVAVASGRSFASLPREVLEIPGIEYAITSNGAAVYRVSEGRRCRQCLLTVEAVEEILAVTPENCAMETFVEGVPYARADYAADPMAFGASPRAVDYIQSTRRRVQDIRAFILKHRSELDAIDVIVRSEEEKGWVRAALKASVQDVYITSSVPQLIEISHRDAGKRAALEWLTQHLNLSLSQTAAFGDAENDREMLCAAGLGVAMENAPDEVKAVADAVTKSCQEDGVAYYIRKILSERN